VFCSASVLIEKYVIFFICPIAGKERKAIFAKPFQKRISEGLFFKMCCKFCKKQLDLI
jgi:hypothetical protein